MALSDWIKVLREKKGWTQNHLAEIAGIPQPTIWRIEKGLIRNPKMELLRRLARALEVTVDVLTEGTQQITALGQESQLLNYLDEPEFATTDEERVDAAFEYVMSDPDYKFGARIRSEGLNIEAKKGIVIVYETLTGKRLLNL